jgi:ATP-dependent DNA helicase RecG
MSSEPIRTIRESETVELKKSLAELKEGLISIAAILNKHRRGELWFGIAPNGDAFGLEINEKTLRDVSQAIAAHIEPRIYPQIEAVQHDGKACLHIAFDGQETPYFAYGRAYIRVADEDRQLSARELEKFILTKNQDALRWDNQPLEDRYADLSTLDAVKLRRFVERAHLTWESLNNAPENALDKLELRKNGQLLNAARLFFANQPIQLRCAVFANTGTATIIDRHDFDGDILELIEEAQKYILKNIHIGMRIEGLYRVDVPEISMEALREAIINAFCHRDWRDPDYVQIAIFKDRVEIRNPGKLYGGLTIEDLHRGNVSKRRNPLIADLFRRIEMVEAWGRGMTLIHTNAPAVSFREVAGLFIASFARPSFIEGERQETVDKDSCTTGIATGKASVLLEFLRQNSQTTIPELAGLLEITEDGVNYHLKRLQKAGMLKREGGRRGGRWVVMSTVKDEGAGV